MRVPVPHSVLCTTGGQGQVTGKKDDMIASATYPLPFCDVAAFLHKGFLASQAIQAQAVRMFVKSLPRLRHTWFWEALAMVCKLDLTGNLPDAQHEVCQTFAVPRVFSAYL